MSRWLPVAAVLLTGCLRLLAAPLPMKSEAHPAPAAPARCLVVFLPGVGDRAYTFEREGFVEAMRRRGLSVDAVAADATVGYYLRGIEAPAIDRDVVAKALSRPYEQVWMVGVSMGGFGTLHYAASFPSRLDGVLVLAPHLGEETRLEQIRDAGGLDMWVPPPPERYHGRNYTEDTWRWLKGVTVEGRPGPAVYVGYGETDLITGRPLLLTAALPESHVLHDSGGHSWGTWKRLWDRFLDDSPLAQRCAAAPPPLAPAQLSARPAPAR
jgi:pimeloyl-ACP methyl ester carboxylesterase